MYVSRGVNEKLRGMQEIFLDIAKNEERESWHNWVGRLVEAWELIRFLQQVYQLQALDMQITDIFKFAYFFRK